MRDNENGNNPRRAFIKNFAAGTAGLGLLGGFPSITIGEDRSRIDNLNKPFRFVHLTDMHVRRGRKGNIGYRQCIDHVNALDPKPDFVLMGGDGPFDGLYTEKDEFEDQIDLFATISDELDMPYYHCIGNHDCLGLSGRRKVPVDDPDLGKKFFMDGVGMQKPYYSFDSHGWHFVVLDCIYEVEVEHGQAVSAAWWGGNWLGFKPGYTVFTAEGDRLSWQRYTFPWDHHLEPEDDLEHERIAEREAFEEQQQILLDEELQGEPILR